MFGYDSVMVGFVLFVYMLLMLIVLLFGEWFVLCYGLGVVILVGLFMIVVGFVLM